MHASELMGKEVLDKNAIKMGRVVDIDLNMSRGTIDHLIIKIGLVKKVLVPITNIEKSGDRVILNLSKDELEKSLATAK